MSKSKQLSTSAAAVALMASLMGSNLRVHKRDSSVRRSNRMNLTPAELQKLSELSGKEKKLYVKQLRTQREKV